MSHENRLAITERISTIVGLGLLAVGLFELSRYQFPQFTRRHISSLGDGCVNEGCNNHRKEDLQAHHICPESVAKKMGVDPIHFHHPANGEMVCNECHLRYHHQNRYFTRAEMRVMVMELYERIIKFHTDTPYKKLTELWKEKILLVHPVEIYNKARVALNELRKKEKSKKKSHRRAEGNNASRQHGISHMSMK